LFMQGLLSSGSQTPEGIDTICRFLTHGPRTAQHLAKLWYVHYIGVFSENFSLSKWFSHNRQLLSKIIADLIPQAWRSPVENK
ncbi:MAG: hypothetical protein ACLRM0_15740, partial [[Clostridium] leptum]